MSLSLLTLKDLCCVRGGRPLFSGLNLALHAGQCVEVRGPNGSGKSTLLRLAAGLYPDYEGGVEAAACFYLGHRPAVSALLSPLENLQWYAKAGPAAVEPGVDGLAAGDTGATRPGRDPMEALAAVGLEACSAVPCGRLSQGQQRRAGLARALLSPHRLWLLDEPLTALDEQGRALVASFVTEHCAAGGAVLCATHQPLGAAGSLTIDLGQRR